MFCFYFRVKIELAILMQCSSISLPGAGDSRDRRRYVLGLPVRSSGSHELNISENNFREFLQMWNKRSLGLKDDIIRFEWSKVKLPVTPSKLVLGKSQEVYLDWLVEVHKNRAVIGVVLVFIRCYGRMMGLSMLIHDDTISLVYFGPSDDRVAEKNCFSPIRNKVKLAPYCHLQCFSFACETIENLKNGTYSITININTKLS